MHTLSSTFVLGYHGCDQAVADRLVSGDDLKPSRNDYDWLGPGIYFWEANPKRGIEYARELSGLTRGPKVTTPAVIGAVIELGLCLDLTTTIGVQQVQDAHRVLVDICREADRPIPENSEDLLRRNLDCAVITTLHDIRKASEEVPVDSIKGVFVEGSPIYPNAGFYDKTHVQICVCNPERIKGVFRVPKRFLS